VSARELERFALLQELSPDERRAVRAVMGSLELAPGEVLFREGEPADGLVLVAAGELRVERGDLGPLGSVGPGGVLGGLALVSAGAREVTAVAARSSRVLTLGRPAFRSLADELPRTAWRLGEALLRDLAGALRDVRGRLTAAAPAKVSEDPVSG
jgi:CRP-like cAMP-binding protein